MDRKPSVLKDAWERYYASLDTARREIENSSRFANAAHRAQAYACVLEAQATAYNHIVAPRFNHPRIFTHTAWATYLYSMPGTCPDITYSILPLDGRYTYRLRGRFGDLRLLLIQVFNKPWGSEGSACIGNHEFVNRDDSNDVIDIILSPTEQKGNWIKLDGSSDFNYIYLRRFLLDWNDDPGELEVEMLGELAGYDEQSEQQMAKRIYMAADFMLAHVRNYAIAVYDFAIKLTAGQKNVWACIPGSKMHDSSGSASCNYGFLPFDIQPDEALIVEMEVPGNSVYWGFQLIDVWDKTLDFMHAQTDINMQQATIDADNKVRAVISLSDPGVANWLDPSGYRQGLCALRDYLSKSFSNPTAKLVKLDELDSHLPADTRRVTPEERRKTVAARRPALLKLYGG